MKRIKMKFQPLPPKDRFVLLESLSYPEDSGSKNYAERIY